VLSRLGTVGIARSLCSVLSAPPRALYRCTPNAPTSHIVPKYSGPVLRHLEWAVTVLGIQSGDAETLRDAPCDDLRLREETALALVALLDQLR
jgi:hypothetical protein